MQFHRTWRASKGKLDKNSVIDELRKQGQSEKVQWALDELPARIDQERHAAALQKFGLDPGELIAKAQVRAFQAVVLSEPPFDREQERARATPSD